MGGPKMTRALKAGLLLSLFALCAISFFVAQKLRERLPSPAPRELFAIVNEQLAAFRSADFQSAYRHAATGVQHKFTLAQFEKMVRQNYPEMTQTQRIEFGEMKVQGGSALLQVFFFSGNGSVRSFLYSFTRENDSWKIDGVQELKGYRSDEGLAGSHA